MYRRGRMTVLQGWTNERSWPVHSEALEADCDEQQEVAQSLGRDDQRVAQPESQEIECIPGTSMVLGSFMIPMAHRGGADRCPAAVSSSPLPTTSSRFERVASGWSDAIAPRFADRNEPQIYWNKRYGENDGSERRELPIIDLKEREGFDFKGFVETRPSLSQKGRKERPKNGPTSTVSNSLSLLMASAA